LYKDLTDKPKCIAVSHEKWYSLLIRNDFKIELLGTFGLRKEL
jgi:hypothetical protein